MVAELYSHDISRRDNAAMYYKLHIKWDSFVTVHSTLKAEHLIKHQFLKQTIPIHHPLIHLDQHNPI